MEAIELVQKECPGQLADFLGCVEANADSWSVQCIDLKHRLTACSQNISGIRAASKVLDPPVRPAPTLPGNASTWIAPAAATRLSCAPDAALDVLY